MNEPITQGGGQGYAPAACSAAVWCKRCHKPHFIFGDSLAELDALLVPMTTQPAFWIRLRQIMADPPPPNARNQGLAPQEKTDDK